MLKRMITLMKKDIKLVTRNWYLFITIFVAVLFSLLVNFVIPENLSLEPTVFILDESEGKALNVMAEDLASKDNGRMVNTREALEEKMKETTGSLGMVLRGTLENPDAEFVVHGYENSKARALLRLEMDDYYGKISSDEDIPIRQIGNTQRAYDVTFNYSLLPMFLLMEPVLMGLFFIATLMLFEKAEGTVGAYAVSPGRTFEYLFSKIIVMFLLGLVSMYFVTLTTVGLRANLGLMFLIAVSGSFFGSSLGLLITSFFDRLSKAMVWIIFVSLMLSAPFASYYLPSFSPLFIRIMPTYSLLFALKETIYQTGQTSIVYEAAGLSLVLGTLLFGAVYKRYNNKLV